MGDLQQIFIGERREQDGFIQAVQELRIERLFHFAHHLVLDLGRQSGTGSGESHGAAFLEETRAQVGGHDDDSVLEVDRVAETIGQLAVFKHLQQDVVDVRMGLLDFIEQDD